MGEPLRRCRVCGFEAETTDDLSLFKKASHYKYGRDQICKKCGNEHQKRWRGANPDKVKASWIKSRENQLKHPNVECANCGTPLYRFPCHIKKSKTGKFFCSQQCHGKYGQTGIKTECAYCGKSLYRKSSKLKISKEFFCNMQCRDKYRVGENGTNWRGGKAEYSYKFFRMRPIVLRRDNYTCQKCGKQQSELKHPLVVHHIDKNKDNNHPINLITICRSYNTKLNRQFFYELETPSLIEIARVNTEAYISTLPNFAAPEVSASNFMSIDWACPPVLEVDP